MEKFIDGLNDKERAFVALHDFYHAKYNPPKHDEQVYKKLKEEHERMYVSLVRKGLGLNEENNDGEV